MDNKEIAKMQGRINRLNTSGIVLLEDGKWGPKSREACKSYITSLMPKVNPWPKPDMASMLAFYGKPGDEANLVLIEFPFPTFYNSKIVRTTRVHKKCAASLLRILTKIGRTFGDDKGVMEEIENYGGCYNYRSKRGSNSLSKHAWGVAIDYDADDNTFLDPWPNRADMSLEVCEVFASEGWKSAGPYWGYDAMHHEATS